MSYPRSTRSFSERNEDAPSTPKWGVVLSVGPNGQSLPELQSTASQLRSTTLSTLPNHSFQIDTGTMANSYPYEGENYLKVWVKSGVRERAEDLLRNDGRKMD